MPTKMHVPSLILALLLMTLLAACGGGSSAGDGQGLQGWEQAGAYDKLYKNEEFDKIKGSFEKFVDVTPMPGMAPGLGLVMRDKADNKVVTVHLGPKSFCADDFKKLDLSPGMQIKAYGAWAEIGGKDVLMATKVKKTEEAYVKVRRTKDGFPHWALSTEERKKEIDQE